MKQDVEVQALGHHIHDKSDFTETHMETRDLLERAVKHLSLMPVSDGERENHSFSLLSGSAGESLP